MINCVLRHFGVAGIFIVPHTGFVKAQISDTTASDNGGEGVFYQPDGGSASINIVLDRVTTDNNHEGVSVFGDNDTGTIQIVLNGVESNNNAFAGVQLTSAVSNIVAEIHESTLSLNAVAGINNAGVATVHLAKSYLTFNTTGILNTGGGTVLSAGDNHIVGNANNVGGPMGSEPLR